MMIQSPSFSKGTLGLDLPLEEVKLGAKEEFAYRPSLHAQRSLILLQQLSAISFFISLYQVGIGSLFAATVLTPFSFSSTIFSFFSLLLSVALFLWSRKVLEAEQDRTPFAEDLIGGVYERTNFQLLLFVAIRAAASPVFIVNELFQRSILEQQAFPNQAYIKALTIALPILELVTLFTFVKGSTIIFNYIKEPHKAISNLIFVSNILLMGSALYLLHSTLSAQAHIQRSDLSKILEPGNYAGLLTIGTILSVLPMLIWLVTYNKWRVPSIITTSVLILTTIALSIFTFNSYRNTRSVRQHSGNVAGEPFLEISNAGFASLMSATMAIIGGLYFWRRPWNFVASPEEKSLKWLGVLGALLIVFFGILVIGENSYIKETHKSFQTEESRILTQEKFESRVNEFLFLNEYDYLILGLKGDTIVQEDQGKLNLTSNDFIEKYSTDKARFALLRTPIDNETDSLALVVWLPETDMNVVQSYIDDLVETIINVAVLEIPIQFVVPDDYEYEASEDEVDSGDFFNSQQLLMSVPSLSRIDQIERKLSQDFQQQITQQRQDIATNFFLSMSLTPYISPKDGIDLFRMIAFDSFKYLVFNYDFKRLRVKIQARGKKDSTFEDFAKNFENGKSKFGLIYLDVDGDTHLVIVIFESQTVTKGREKIFGHIPMNDLTDLSAFGVSIYLTNDVEELKLDKVIASIKEEKLQAKEREGKAKTETKETETEAEAEAETEVEGKTKIGKL